MKLAINITPELRIRLMHAQTLEIEMPIADAPEGWRLVPESWLPDGDGQIPSCMSAAGARRLKVLADLDLTYYELDEVFRAMLAAAPKLEGGIA